MSTTFKEFVEQVRARSDLVEVIGADVQLRPAGSTLKGLSPFHAEKDPSFVVWPQSQRWRDYSSGGEIGGDVFDYVEQRRTVGFKEAVFELAERCGVRRPNQDEESFQRELAALLERREAQRLLTAAAAYYHRVLPTKIREEWYRRHYGFTDGTVDDLHLGWADGHLLEHFRDTLGVGREQALKTGLFVVVGGGRVEDFFRDRLVFPYWRDHQVVYFIARVTEYTGDAEWEKSKYKKLLTHSERHDYVSPTVGNDYLFNEDAARGADELVIVEGVTDAISAMQSGVPCISPVTTRFRRQDLPRLLQLTRGARRIIVCNDSERSGAGEAGARETAAALWAEGQPAHVAVIPLPDGKDKIDVNELVARQGPQALREVLAGARSYPEHLLDQIPSETPTADLERVLEPVLESLSCCSAIQADGLLDAVTRKFRLRRRTLLSRVKEISARRHIDALAARPPAMQVPEVRVNGRQLREVVEDAHRVVVASNAHRIKTAAAETGGTAGAPLFVRGGALMRLQRPDDGAPVLGPLGESAVFGYLLREADWVQETEKGKFPAFPPKEIARDLLAYPPPEIPTLETVITTPVFGRDGALIATPGLHAADRLWLEVDAGLDVGAVPAHPTAEQVAAARSLFLDDLLVDFPFVAPSDRAHLMAAVLLPFVHRMIDGCTPLHVIEAPTVGAGKGLLANLISLVVTGKPCDARTMAENDEEVRKMLTAELSKARPIILLDNAREGTTLASAPLASVLTATSWTDRSLGRTEVVTLTNTAMWLLTGNNVRLSRDIARRSVRIRIDPKQDRAWRRTGFKHDPIQSWARANRDELVHAALVLVQAWLAAGRPLSRERLGSFEHWAAVMGGVLQVAGIEGFLGSLEEMYASADEEGEAWREFTLAWWDEHGTAEVHTSTLTELCERHDLLPDVRGEGTARSQQSRLGRALQGARDRVFGGLQLVQLKQDRKKKAVYVLRSVSGTVPERLPSDDAGEVDPWDQ